MIGLLLIGLSLAQVPKGKVAIAAVSTNHSLAERVIADCAPALNIQLVTLNPERK
jgi:hypothetical protein